MLFINLFTYVLGGGLMLSRKLKIGNTIGVICPASGQDRDTIDKKIMVLENLGFNVKLGSHIYDINGYLAGSDENRCDDLMTMFTDDSVDMIMCFRGGYGSMRILNNIDFKVIKKNPKIFIGYSDITALLNAIYFKTNLITFHGPMVGSNLEGSTLTSFMETFTTNNKLLTIGNPENIPMKTFGNGCATGIIVGGNLSIICATLNTPYAIDFRDKILFIEEVNEEPYSLDRMLCQLTLANKLSQCKGFILGQFKNCNNSNGDKKLTLENVLDKYIFSLNKPTIYNFMSGHDTPKLTLPIGAKCTLDVKSPCIKILESVVK